MHIEGIAARAHAIARALPTRTLLRHVRAPRSSLLAAVASSRASRCPAGRLRLHGARSWKHMPTDRMRSPVLGGLLLVLLLFCLAVRRSSSDGAPPAGLVGASDGDGLYNAMADLVLPHGYPLEEHFVTTPDGYVLRLYRMPHGIKKDAPRGAAAAASHEPHYGPPAAGDVADHLQHKGIRGVRHAARSRLSTTIDPEGRPVVYLQHALADSTADWVLQGPGKSLAFVLADAGYDVWMGNIRGNRFSRNHTKLDPNKSAQFWAFSFDQHAAVDLPELINTSLAKSGGSRLAYVGYSQGTLIAFAALSSQPELAQKVTIAVLLAPVAFVTKIESLPLKVSALMDTDKIYEMLGIKEYAAHSPTQATVLGWMCGVRPSACLALLGAVGGSNDVNVDPDLLPRFFQYFPAGTSVQNMAHWSQAVRQGNRSELRWYDWGRECADSAGVPKKCNQAIYGQPTAPSYNVAGITTPLALFTGGQDLLADPADIQLLLSVLPPATVVRHHHEPSYCHWDFGIGTDLPSRIYPEILQLLSSYPPSVTARSKQAV